MAAVLYNHGTVSREGSMDSTYGASCTMLGTSCTRGADEMDPMTGPLKTMFHVAMLSQSSENPVCSRDTAEGRGPGTEREWNGAQETRHCERRKETQTTSAQ